MQKVTPGRALALLAALFTAAVVALIILLHNAGPQEIPIGGGRSVEWLGVTTGTNRLRYGSPLQKILGYFVPIGGVAIAGLYFPSPEILAGSDDVDVTAWLTVHGTGVSPQGFDYYWKGSEVITSNRTGRQFSLNTPQPFRTDSNQVVLSVPLTAFPRDQKRVILKLSPPVEPGMKRRWIDFEFENPFRSPGPIWTAPSAPITNRLGESEFVLTSAGTNTITFKVPSDDWWATDCRMADNEGNKFGFSSEKWPKEGVVKMCYKHRLELNRVWRVQATFVKGRGKNYAYEERRTVRLTPNVSEVTLTNGAGDLFLCQLTRNRLQIHNAQGIDRPHWVVLSATNENAEAIAIAINSAWTTGPGGSEFQVWHLPKPCAVLNLELACPSAVTAVFMVMPKQD